MMRTTRILFFGLLLFASTAAMAGQGRDRDDYRSYRGDQHHHAHRHDGHRHYVRYVHPAPVHFHHGRYCRDWHPNGYVAPLVRYGYGGPGLVIVYQPKASLYLGGGR